MDSINPAKSKTMEILQQKNLADYVENDGTTAESNKDFKIEKSDTLVHCDDRDPLQDKNVVLNCSGDLLTADDDRGEEVDLDESTGGSSLR